MEERRSAAAPVGPCEVRPYEDALAEAVRAFEAAATARYLSQAPQPPGGEAGPGEPGQAPRPRPAVVALTLSGEVVGAGYLDPEGDCARFVLAMHTRYQHGPTTLRLLQALCEAASACGCTKLTTLVTGEGAPMRDDFRLAGLEVESSLWAGGVSEVVLRIPA